MTTLIVTKDNLNSDQFDFGSILPDKISQKAAPVADVKSGNATTQMVTSESMKAAFDGTSYSAGISYPITVNGSLYIGHGQTGDITNTFTGYHTGLGNTVTNTTGFGLNSCLSNNGANTAGFGLNSCLSNNGANTTGIGTHSCSRNDGNFTTGVGTSACASNTGLDTTGLGVNSCIRNTGDKTTGIGMYSCVDNTYNNVCGVGHNSRPTSDNEVKLGDNIVSSVRSSGTFYGAAFTVTSDKRLKSKIEPIDRNLASKFKSGLNWVSYRKSVNLDLIKEDYKALMKSVQLEYSGVEDAAQIKEMKHSLESLDTERHKALRDANKNTRTEYGLIAQEVEELTKTIGAFNEVVEVGIDGYLSLNYTSIQSIINAAG